MATIGTIETTDCTCEGLRGGVGGCGGLWGVVAVGGCGGLRGLVWGVHGICGQGTRHGAAQRMAWCAEPHRELDRHGRVEQREVAARETDLAPLQGVARDAPSL